MNWKLASSNPCHEHYLLIRRTLMATARRIQLETCGVVAPQDIRFRVSPATLGDWIESDEIQSWLENNDLPAIDRTGKTAYCGMTIEGVIDLPDGVVVATVDPQLCVRIVRQAIEVQGLV